jgi:LPXTG-site transpeptidase (sortase) family protein
MVAFLLCLIVVILISFVGFSMFNFESTSIAKSKEQVKDTEIIAKATYENNNANEENVEEAEENVDEAESEAKEPKYDWSIEIPKIGLYAGIKEGTDMETLNQAVGHFDETEMEFGNVGLAAHNRGYAVNYFERLKEVQKDDEIIYVVNGKEHSYTVSKIEIIYETDWSMLENTEDNRITLITCVENREKYRLCVQAIEQ